MRLRYPVCAARCSCRSFEHAYLSALLFYLANMLSSSTRYVKSHGTLIRTPMTACAPSSNADDRYEGCYDWCSKNVSNCARCKCKACMRCSSRSGSRAEAAGFSHGGCTSTLVVVVRGEAFRDGAMRTRTSTGDTAVQLAALSSLSAHALAPARRAGWTPLVVADVALPKVHERRFEAVMRGSLGAVAVRMRPLEATQTGSLQSTLAWVLRHVVNQTDWGALLLTRADLEIKAALRLPSPADSPWRVRVPFRAPPGPAALSPQGLAMTSGGLVLADAIHFVPRCRLDELRSRLEAATAAPPYGASVPNRPPVYHNTLHWLCAWLGAGIDYWSQGVFDSNSEHEANPIYRHVGRAEGPVRSPSIGTKPRAPAQACGEGDNAQAAAISRLQQRCAAVCTS